VADLAQLVNGLQLISALIEEHVCTVLLVILCHLQLIPNHLEDRGESLHTDIRKGRLLDCLSIQQVSCHDCHSEHLRLFR